MKSLSIIRNKTLVLTLLCSSFLLSACSSSDELSEELSRDYQTTVGEFKSLGGVEVQEIVTHLFETEDGEILYAYSERYDLDDEAYFGTTVQAYGIVTTYENLEKPLFEVKQISDAPEKTESTEEVTQVEYQDPDLGFTMSYPSNWALTSTPTSVILEAPLKTADEEDASSNESSAAELAPQELSEMPLAQADTIVIEKTSALLIKTAEDPQEDRVAEIRSYVAGLYTDLVGVESDLTYAGPDRLLSVRYKTSDGDTTYFVPRGSELFQLSYYHEEDEYNDRLENSNVFASLVSGFQFTPYGEGDGSTPDAEPAADAEPVEEPETVTTPSADQVTMSSYRDLESVPYEFTMNYPGNWYYGGSSTGYVFSDKPTDDESTTPILTMTFNSGSAAGVSRSGESTSITVEVDGRSYTLSGPAEYESVMQTMIDSITSTKE